MASLEATNELKDEDRNSLSPRPKTRSLSVTHVLLEAMYAPDEVWGRDKDSNECCSLFASCMWLGASRHCGDAGQSRYLFHSGLSPGPVVSKVLR